MVSAPRLSAGSVHLVGGSPDGKADNDGTFLDDRTVRLCGWCHVEGPILNEDDLERELDAAARDSVAWRWRWSPARR